MNTVPRFLVFVLAIIVLSSCSQNQPKDQPKNEPQPQDGLVKLTLSSEQTVVNGLLNISIAVEGDKVNRVDLLKDGQKLVTLERPFTYTWDAGQEQEGSYSLQARVIQGKTFLSEPLAIVVDRTEPQIDQAPPSDKGQPLILSEGIALTFSEPIDAATVTESQVVVKHGKDNLEANLQLSSDGLTLTIAPDVSKLKFPAELSVKLKGIRDIAGNTIKDVSYSWDLSYWIALGERLNQDPASSVSTSQMTFDSQQYPLVLFSETNADPDTLASTQVYVKRWNGSEWQLLGNTINSETGYAQALQIITDSSDQPLIAYTEYASVDDLINGNEPKIYIKQWTGAAWQFVTRIDAPAYGFSSVDLKSDGKHILKLWEPDLVTIKQWNGGNWKILSNISITFSSHSETSNTQVFDTSVQLDLANNPVVAWVEYDALTMADFRLHVQRWSGSAWESVGNEALNISSSATIVELLLSLDKNNQPVMAWTEFESEGAAEVRQLYFKRWNGSGWESFQDSSVNINKATDAVPSSVTFDPQGNPVLSWTELGEPARTYAKAWKDNTWQLIGGSRLNSNTSGEARGVVAFNNQGVPFVIVQEKIDGVNALFIRRANQ
jgi:Bacterial Ig-like domain